MKTQKTNAMRLLESLGIPYTPHAYDPGGGIDGLSVALKTGQNPERVYKTLCTRGTGGGIYVFCIPVAAELDLKAAARAAGVKGIEMLPLAQVNAVTGYLRGGVSPFAMKRRYPTFVEAAAACQRAILVSGGRVGLQIELAPADLAGALNAPFAQLTGAADKSGPPAGN